MNLIETYNSMSYETITDFIKNKQEENLHLDFKTVNKSDMADKEDRKNYARAISGYANSDGGIIVWGVVASKNDQGIDCARDTKPLENPKLFINRLNNLCGNHCTPIVDGILHKIINIPDSEKGFAVSLIPPSDSGPHMATGGEDRYYKRSGDSFYKMEHFDIEDMFGRRKKPRLDLHTKIVFKEIDTERYDVKVIISLENKGRGIAFYPCLKIKTSNLYFQALNAPLGNTEGLKRLPHPGYNPGYEVFCGSADNVIHSNTIYEVTCLGFRIGSNINEKTIKDKETILDYTISAQDMIQVTSQKRISASEYVEAYEKYKPIASS